MLWTLSYSLIEDTVLSYICLRKLYRLEGSLLSGTDHDVSSFGRHCKRVANQAVNDTFVLSWSLHPSHVVIDRRNLVSKDAIVD